MSRPAPCTGCTLLNMCVRDNMPACEELFGWRSDHAELRRDDRESAEHHRHEMQDKADRSGPTR